MPNRTTQAEQPLTITLSIEGGSANKIIARLEDVIEAAIRKVLTESRPTNRQSQEPRRPPFPWRTDNDAQPSDLRLAVLMNKVPEDCGLLIDTHQVAKLLDVSERTIFALEVEKNMPAAVRLGRMVRWRLAEILEWVDAGCPPQDVWVQKKKVDSGQQSGATEGAPQ
jgi:predicted DNA-binding transcriptional regulator AlpA